MSALIVTLGHLNTVPGFSKRPGFCRAGARRFFAAHGLDWSDFVLRGIHADKLTATGDAMALALVDWARRCDAEGVR